MTKADPSWLDRTLRTASLESLKRFLSSRPTLPVTDAMKLWKGLYFAMWMTDRPVPQQRLAGDLGRLADDAPISAADLPAWFAAFWDVVGQQWSSIDKHRLDKFLMLVRRVLAANLRHAMANKDVAEVLARWPLDKEGDLRAVPLGLRLHVLDILVDELEREGILVADGSNKKGDALVKNLGQVLQELFSCPIKQVRERSRETYDDERFPWTEAKEEDGEDDDEWGGFDD